MNLGKPEGSPGFSIAGAPWLARLPRPGPCLDFGLQYALIRNNWPKFAVAHKGLKLSKRFTNLPFDFSGYPGEKGRACNKRKKILRIQL